ncbi:hypothetical protein F5Y00DRAFT_261175 [Daldinia vernicosa]|uniref:uncharacterized protein n=1 Tax=Daldinia vernicosa TaxID=114800 RepID=UPI002007F77B|nr:uncharacterized protein F5Y00DRAFT_261175 [Daldinia vernicosa]KAI0849730.1 hypothetical protein F5Y00DRAFT_261175 [Daldinia vernicosa]
MTILTNGNTSGINNALLGIEIPELVERLREAYKDDADKPLTPRTGWKPLWDVRLSKVTITEQHGTSWEQKVGEMSPSVQEIVAKGGVVGMADRAGRGKQKRKRNVESRYQ